ncbi:MAG TPA: alginate lyase family protein [Candidatus Saccharimonadales bacterium]|jgi:hypothetical protein|nr:alginate lyase family protein [Candidatus Saccharimonadales bacterium]
MPVDRPYTEIYKRLAGMGRDEVRVRTRQALAKRWDRFFGKYLVRTAWSQGASGEVSGRFFFSNEQVPEILQCLRERLPKTAEAIIERADRICRHQFDLLGYERVDYGPEIDWHLDGVHGKQAPRDPWFKVPYLEFEQVGDSKVTWELNRHQHLVTLAKAYRLTGEARYAQELFHQWYDWQKSNPYGIGINWASSLEVAFRSLSWLWVRHLLNGCPVVPMRFPVDLWRALMLNARHIERYLSTYFSPNTHLLGEGMGLFFIGTLYPGSPFAERIKDRGWRIVLEQAERQVRPDGMHFEQSAYYHVYALDFLLHARILAAGNGVPAPPMLDETLERMLEALCVLRTAGPMARFGDDDGGRLFASQRNRTEHLRDPLATGALLFNRGDFKAAAGTICEEAIWLLGPDSARRFDELLPREREDRSTALESSGIYVMSAAQPEAQQLVIDGGPHGAGRGGHGHADALSIQLAINGEPVLIDPGTFVYSGPGAERDQFRKTSAHNTMQVDACGQSEPAGLFTWHNMATASTQRWLTGTNFDLFAGSHDGYGRLPSGVQHRRYVFYWKPRFWLVRDVLEGSGAHGLDLYWHFATGSVAGNAGELKFYQDGEAALALLFTAAHDWTQKISQGWNAPVYGKKEPVPVLRFSTHTTLPVECATLLVPLSGSTASPRRFRLFESIQSDMTVHGYRFSWGEDTNYVFFADKAGTWQAGDWSSDARFLFCAMDSAGTPGELVICDGSYMELRGRRIFSSGTHLSWSERRGNVVFRAK